MYKHLGFAILAAWLCLAACDDYDAFTTDRSRALLFSRDSVAFDTLLTTLPSSTQTLVVHNVGDEGLRIGQVALASGAGSPFRVNVDGQDMSRTEANLLRDFEVRRRDSIIVRIEVTLPRIGSDSLLRVADELLFTLESGIVQSVPLSVVGRDAYFLRGQTLLSDTTFSPSRPTVVYDSLVVAPGVTLTLPAGTQLYFHEGAGLTVHGRLLAEGTAEAPVVMRGDRTDHMFDYLPYDRLPSRWEGLHLTALSTGNRLDHLDLHSGCYGIRCDSTDAQAAKLVLTNSRIHNIGGNGLDVRDCRVEVANTEISNTLGHGVAQLGGDLTCTHCTIAQFYPLDAARGNAVNISFYADSTTCHHLRRADFQNCVVTGYADDVILIPSLDPNDWPRGLRGQNPEVNYRFLHSFLATEVPDGGDYAERFVECVFDDPKADSAHEKNFLHFDAHDFLYDFTPVAASPIRSMADPVAAAPWPFDRLGRSRLADGAPDAGCYEYAGEDEP